MNFTTLMYRNETGHTLHLESGWTGVQIDIEPGELIHPVPNKAMAFSPTQFEPMVEAGLLSRELVTLDTDGRELASEAV